MTIRTELAAGPVFRQRRIGLSDPPTPQEIETRYRCLDAGHEGRLYNPDIGGTFCMCGRAVWPGDVTVRLSTYERAEADAGRTDEVGSRARAWLGHVHGQHRPGALLPE